MGNFVKYLQPGSLYITIALPPLAPYQPLPADFYPPYLLRDFDPTNYETAVANGFGHEEFAWGLYWLPKDEGHGVWYTLLRQQHNVTDAVSSCSSSSSDENYAVHSLFRISISASAMRLNPNVVGLIRVMTLPQSITSEMSIYLDWLTSFTGPTASRSFLWATSAYMRCRMHVAHTYSSGDGGKGFDVNRFLRGALAFAYGEVWHLLVGGRLPRPIMVSEYGVELQALQNEQDHDKGMGTAACAKDEKETKGAGNKAMLSGPDPGEEARRKRESKQQLDAMIRRYGLDQMGVNGKTQ